MQNYLDNLGREVKVGDIVYYPTSLDSSSIHGNYAVIEELKDKHKIKVSKVEILHYNTPSGNYHINATYDPNSERTKLKNVTIRSTTHCLIVTDMDLPNKPIFNALRKRSQELLNG